MGGLGHNQMFNIEEHHIIEEASAFMSVSLNSFTRIAAVEKARKIMVSPNYVAYKEIYEKQKAIKKKEDDDFFREELEGK